MENPRYKIDIVQPIRLSDEQRKELIRICNETWPELKFHFYGYTDYIGYDETEVGEDIVYPELRIHWFEFLVTAVMENEIEALEKFYYSL